VTRLGSVKRLAKHGRTTVTWPQAYFRLDAIRAKGVCAKFFCHPVSAVGAEKQVTGTDALEFGMGFQRLVFPAYFKKKKVTLVSPTRALLMAEATGAAIVQLLVEKGPDLRVLIKTKSQQGEALSGPMIAAQAWNAAKVKV